MEAVHLLRLLVEWGVDEALEDAPVNRLHNPPEIPSTAVAPMPSTPAAMPAPRTADLPRGPTTFASRAPGQPPSAPQSNTSPSASAGQHRTPAGARAPGPTPAERALAAASGARDLAALRAAIAAFDGCALRDTAANLVFAEGPADASLLVIGDAPGEAEDRNGTPFCGPDGALLDRMLASIGLTRATIMLTPLVPWRPPGGRPPTTAEIALCRPFMHRLIALVAPARLILMGPLAARTFMSTHPRRAQPQWRDITIPESGTFAALVMPSPAVLAKQPSMRREAWTALRLLRHTLNVEITKK